jgi:hypothetical protein
MGRDDREAGASEKNIEKFSHVLEMDERVDRRPGKRGFEAANLGLS